MKVSWRISDDLGTKRQMQGTRSAEGSWQLLKELINDPAVEARFKGCKFAHVFIHLSPAASEYSGGDHGDRGTVISTPAEDDDGHQGGEEA